MLSALLNGGYAPSALNYLKSVPTVKQGNTAKFTSSDAAIVSIKNNLSSVKIEKHIDDYEKGKGYLSKSISADLRKLDLDNSLKLASQDITAFKSYLLNSTALNYQNKARYIEAVSDAAETVSRINSASEQDPGAEIMQKYEELKNQIEEVGQI
ncbi:MAG: hypothetical protein KDD56_02860 [Bdellovibrionales bacterium]|nr:hypothetical protein [Bdellovibrionales bacterium]